MKCVSLCMCIFTLLPIFIEAGLLLQKNDKKTEIVNSTILNENQPRFKRQYADPCTSRPCQNGGICTQNGNSFHCTCYAPFFGPRCQQSPCTNNPCYNDGICMVNGYSYVCNCRPPYFGATCELACKCKNGFCQVGAFGNVLCNCLPEYGHVSDTECNACNCGPGATCTFKGFFGPKKCNCPPYSYEQSGKCVEFCGSKPCKNGKCKRELVRPYCQCDINYSGAFCETYSVLCGSKPCKNGKCKRELSLPYCQCDTNYSGEFCETYSGKEGKTKIYIISGGVVIFIIALICLVICRCLQDDD